MKIVCYWIFLVLVVALMSNAVQGQQWIAHQETQGLQSDENINAILEDNSGSIWIATDEGVYTTNNTRSQPGYLKLWTNFSYTSTDTFINELVNCAAIDSEGYLWFGTEYGVTTVASQSDLQNPHNWITYTTTNTDSGLKQDIIKAIAVDRDGNIWCGTKEQGICVALKSRLMHGFSNEFYANPDNWKHLSFPNDLPSNYITALASDSAGAIWVGTFDGVVRFNSDFSPTHRFDQIKDARTIFNDSRGYVWLGTFGTGVWQLHQDSLQIQQHYPTVGKDTPFKYVCAITEDKDGFIWFGHTERSSPSIALIDPRLNMAEPANWVELRISIYNVSNLFKDRDGNIWIGTLENGLTQFDDTWTTFSANGISDSTGLNDNIIRALFIDKNFNLWIGTETGGLSKFQLPTNPLIKNNWQSFRNINNSIFLDTIRSLYRDSDGYLWVGTQFGIYRVDPDKDLFNSDNWLNFRKKNHEIKDAVYAIAEDDSGYIWIGTSKGLWRTHNNLIVDSRNYWAEKYDTSNGLAHNFVLSLLAAKDGMLWIGTVEGMNRIDPRLNLADKNNWKKFIDKDGLVDNSVTAILQDRDGYLWFGTRGGVSKIDPESDLHIQANWKNFTISDGLPSNHITSILQPTDNEIWIGTSNGIGKLDLFSNQHWTIYTAGDGLGEDWVLSLAADTIKGDIWIGTLAGGITRYRAKKLAPETYLKNRFDIVTEDNIMYEFVGSDLTTPNYDLLYSYCFNNSNNGNDKAKWSAFSSATTATLVIPRTDRPARYVFKVKAMDKDGNIDPTPATDIFWKINEPMGGWTSKELNRDTVKIYIPPKTYIGQDLLINPIPSYKLPDAPSIVLAYEILLPPNDSLNKPATMRIILKNHEMLNATNLAIFKLTENSSWIGIGGTVEAESDSTISITTSFTEFATYAVRRDRLIAAAMYSDEIQIQPRLFSPNGAGQGHGDRVTISFMLKEDSPASVKIYNLAGRLKRVLVPEENIRLLKGTNAIEWDGRDVDGNFCPTGLYIVTVEAEGDVKTKTVMVSNKY